MIAIAVIILAIYLTVKAINLVVRVLSKYPVSKCPGCKIVWVCLGCVFVCVFPLYGNGRKVGMYRCGNERVRKEWYGKVREGVLADAW